MPMMASDYLDIADQWLDRADRAPAHEQELAAAAALDRLAAAVESLRS